MGKNGDTGEAGRVANAAGAGDCGRADDMEHFVAFLRREAADYHEPPAVPADAMWAAVEGRLAGDDDVGDAGGAPVEALGYHEPPPAPREAMWERIESAWVARRPVEPVEQGAGETASGPIRLAAVRGLGRRRRRTVIWLTGAAAASVALAVGLDRGQRLPVPAGLEVAAVAAPESVAATDSGPIAPLAAGATRVAERVEEPLETSRQFAATPPPAAAAPPPRPTAGEAEPPVRAAVASASRARSAVPPARPRADEYDTARHLDRAATLLVAFRTDIGTDESQGDLARWARELLVETRSLIDTPAAEGQREQGLLRDLELVLVQIARLGPDAPDFERELARESMERQGALMRLRSTSGT